MRSLTIVLHKGYTNLHSHQQSTRVFFSSHPFQWMLSLVFYVIDILADVRWHLLAIICISLVPVDMEHFFYIPVDCTYIFFWEMSIPILCSFLNQVFSPYCSVWVPYKFRILSLYQMYYCKYAFPFLRLSLNSVDCLPGYTEAF